MRSLMIFVAGALTGFVAAVLLADRSPHEQPETIGFTGR